MAGESGVSMWGEDTCETHLEVAERGTMGMTTEEDGKKPKSEAAGSRW